eukprot:COSAG02_NODE_3278_length_7026_cov_28.128771_5_plen_64_part_00
MQINELMSDSIEISYHFDELSNVIDSAMHGTSLIHTSLISIRLRRIPRQKFPGRADVSRADDA